MTNQRPSKRKLLNLKVNRALQVGMIIRIICILFVCLLLCSTVYFFLADREITASFRTFHVKAQNFLDFLLPAIIGSFVVSLVVGIIASLFFPKNYAGGLYGIERDVRKVLDGNPAARIRLRRGDAALPLAAMINDLLNSFDEQMSHMADGLSKAEAVFASTDLTQEERIGEIKKIHASMQHEIKKLKNDDFVKAQGPGA